MKTKNRNFIKKSLLGVMSAAAIMAGSVMPAFADTSDATNASSFSFQKQYTYSYPTGVDSSNFSYPKEKFVFTSSEGEGKAALGKISDTTLNSKQNEIEDIPSGNTTIPKYIIIHSADYSADTNNAREYSDGKFTTSDLGVQVSIPSDATFPSPGIYYYSFEEKNNKTAGIDYDYNGTGTYWIAVLVTLPETSTTSEQASAATQSSSTKQPTPTSIILYQNSKDEKGNNIPDTTKKISGIINRYVAGQFDVTKTVTGNLGDLNKEFNITVTFTSNKPVMTPIIVTSTDTTTKTTIKSYDSAATNNDWSAKDDGSYSYSGTYKIKNGTTLSFNNIPYGVNFNATEDDYSSDGYTAKYYQVNQDNTKSEINADAKQEMNGAQTYKLEIVNNKQQELPTGVFTSNLPYFIIIFAATGGLVIFLVSKKHRA